MNKVAVLCRGKSLAGIEHLPDDIDLYILVNRFGDELQIEEIGNYLKNKKYLSKHVVSIFKDRQKEIKRKEYSFTKPHTKNYK